MYILQPTYNKTSVSALHNKIKAEQINDARSLRMEATFCLEIIHASIPRELGGNRVQGILPGHLVQELNVSIVLLTSLII